MQNVRAICAAAAGSCGEEVFSFPENRQAQGKLTSVEKSYDNHGSNTFRVRAVTLDSVVHETGRSLSFLKIDVEGAAGAVLSGVGELLRQVRPTILLELHAPDDRAAARDLAVGFD